MEQRHPGLTPLLAGLMPDGLESAEWTGRCEHTMTWGRWKRGRDALEGRGPRPGSGSTASTEPGRMSGMANGDYVTRDQLRAELAELKVELIRWGVGVGVGLAGVSATLAVAVLRFLGG